MGTLLVLAAVAGPTLAPFDPTAAVAPQLAEPMPPAAPFYLGTDDLGRDVLSRLLYGARISLLVGLVAMVVDDGDRHRRRPHRRLLRRRHRRRAHARRPT